MKLTRASSYALHAMAYLAQKKSEKPIASHIIADERKIPERFLLKILKPLVSARMLDSIKGPNGGYKLRKQPSDITMLDIIEAVEGPIRGESPFSGKGNTALNTKIATVCRTSAEVAREHLARVSLADLASAKKEGRKGK
jgi:Rrf2 family protein